jgi:hypothetical protein
MDPAGRPPRPRNGNQIAPAFVQVVGCNGGQARVSSLAQHAVPVGAGAVPASAAIGAAIVAGRESGAPHVRVSPLGHDLRRRQAPVPGGDGLPAGRQPSLDPASWALAAGDPAPPPYCGNPRHSGVPAAQRPGLCAVPGAGTPSASRRTWAASPARSGHFDPVTARSRPRARSGRAGACELDGAPIRRRPVRGPALVAPPTGGSMGDLRHRPGATLGVAA